MEEFKAHLHCLGFTEEDVLYTSTEVQTPPWGGGAPGQVLFPAGMGGWGECKFSHPAQLPCCASPSLLEHPTPAIPGGSGVRELQELISSLP